MFKSKVGQNIPESIFHTIAGDKWINISSNDVFKNKNVIVFSLPGAFTPTCSSSHLPRFNELAPIFAKYGIDEIVCISVNDTFVMNAWKKDQEAENITMLPDGNGDFTNNMGMLVDEKEIGFGKRSWRYSMLVKNGVVDKMFIEPNKPGDPFEVSDADTMLNYIAPEHKHQPSVTMFTKPGCPYCVKAKQALSNISLPFEEVILGKDVTSVSLKAITNKTSVPQVFIGGEYIGGSEELINYLDK